jgi:hypothetical protein
VILCVSVVKIIARTFTTEAQRSHRGPQRLIEAGDNNWSNRQKILDDAVEFAKNGRLLKLEFPKTEIQMYGFTAVLYSNYSYELEMGGQHINRTGRVTEVFVLRKGQWVRVGIWIAENRIRLRPSSIYGGGVKPVSGFP